MNAHTVNKHIRSLGVKICRGEGYYYWLDPQDGLVVAEAPSVYVYRASDLTLDHWWDLAAEAAKFLTSKRAPVSVAEGVS